MTERSGGRVEREDVGGEKVTRYQGGQDERGGGGQSKLSTERMAEGRDGSSMIDRYVSTVVHGWPRSCPRWKGLVYLGEYVHPKRIHIVFSCSRAKSPLDGRCTTTELLSRSSLTSPSQNLSFRVPCIHASCHSHRYISLSSLKICLTVANEDIAITRPAPNEIRHTLSLAATRFPCHVNEKKKKRNHHD